MARNFCKGCTSNRLDGRMDGGDGVPRNLLNNVADESSPLAQMTLLARHTGLWLVRGDFLHIELASAT